MSLVSSVEAAEKLQLTRQRVAMLLRNGQLIGEQTARGQWLINSRSINEYQARKSGPGRPWSAETSWALLAELDGHRSSTLTSSTAARVRSRIRDTEAAELARKVATRTVARSFAADDRKKTAADLILTGRSAAEQIGTDLVRQDRVVEGYLRDVSETIEAFARRHLLVPDADGDVTIFERPACALFDDGRAGDAVVAADLARSTDTRERSAGLGALEKARQEWLAKHTK